MPEADKKKPKREAAGIAHGLTRAGIQLVPLIGGSAAELFSMIICPPLEKRRDEWLESLGERLEDLEKRFEGFKTEYLPRNEAFVTTALQASHMAVRNHQKEKLEALRNAVLNSALPNAPEDDLQRMFLNWIDVLTSWHIRILKFFKNPARWFQEQGRQTRSAMGQIELLDTAFPELQGRREFCDQIVKDLFSRGLLIASVPFRVDASRTTDLGNAFISFIESPLKE